MRGIHGGDRLRVALLAGTLAQGGAEKQLLYIVRSLIDAGVDVQVFCLTRGDFYEEPLKQLGAAPEWIGQSRRPLRRVHQLRRCLKTFRPHILQGIHFYNNLHIVLAAGACGAVTLGGLRGDTDRELAKHPLFGKWLLRLPPAIVANSRAAATRAVEHGCPRDAVCVLENVIDLDAFDRPRQPFTLPEDAKGRTIVAAVGRLVAAKRFDRFLEAVADACRQGVPLHGLLVGDGPERGRLEAHAQQLGLGPQQVTFLGQRNDVPAILKSSHMLVVSSDQEGMPNVAMEAMAARLPVVATPAGDAADLVEHERTGTIVPMDDPGRMAAAMARLARSPALRRRYGAAGRLRIEQAYDYQGLLPRLLDIYLRIARRQGRRAAASAVARLRDSFTPAEPIEAVLPPESREQLI